MVHNLNHCSKPAWMWLMWWMCWTSQDVPWRIKPRTEGSTWTTLLRQTVSVWGQESSHWKSANAISTFLVVVHRIGDNGVFTSLLTGKRNASHGPWACLLHCDKCWKDNLRIYHNTLWWFAFAVESPLHTHTHTAPPPPSAPQQGWVTGAPLFDSR